MMSLKSALGSKLYHARTQRNFTQAQVAEATQISIRWYQKLERGSFLPSAAVLIRLFIFWSWIQTTSERRLVWMKIYQFLPVEERLFSPELGAYISYGIRVLALDSSGQNEAAFISDVSCDVSFVTDLAYRCTRLQLDPLHLLDVVLDSLH